MVTQHNIVTNMVSNKHNNMLMYYYQSNRQHEQGLFHCLVMCKSVKKQQAVKSTAVSKEQRFDNLIHFELVYRHGTKSGKPHPVQTNVDLDGRFFFDAHLLLAASSLSE